MVGEFAAVMCVGCSLARHGAAVHRAGLDPPFGGLLLHSPKQDQRKHNNDDRAATGHGGPSARERIARMMNAGRQHRQATADATRHY